MYRKNTIGHGLDELGGLNGILLHDVISLNDIEFGIGNLGLGIGTRPQSQIPFLQFPFPNSKFLVPNSQFPFPNSQSQTHRPINSFLDSATDIEVEQFTVIASFGIDTVA
jgi:hypothetical protein